MVFGMKWKQVESPSSTRDDSEIEVRGESTQGQAFKTFGLETKSSLRLDFRARAGLIYRSVVIYPKG